VSAVAERAPAAPASFPALRSAIARTPAAAEHLFNYGFGLVASRRPFPALDYFRRCLGLDARSAAVQAAVGTGYMMRNLARAGLPHLRRAATLDPSLPTVWINLAQATQVAGDGRSAVELCRWAQALSASIAESVDLALALASCGAYDDAGRLCDRGVDRRRGLRWRGTEPEPVDPSRSIPMPASTSTSRLRHDAEQFRYLVARGLASPAIERWAKEYEDVLAGFGKPGHRILPLSLAQRQRLAPVYDRIFHRSSAGASVSEAIGPHVDASALEAAYRQRGLVVVDDLLSETALANLYLHCLETTMWSEGVGRPYVMAILENGFACPLLLQIADSLAKRLPGIFGGTQLRQSWAFKYDSASEGTGLHADEAAVNVNFWITPDSANLNPGSGGLVVYDQEAPLDWDFDEFNADQASIRAFLDGRNARPIVVPYRQNRAVIFNSNFFHRTDDFKFREGYENRRINVTLLYGFRGPIRHN
jgi:tetratricopeptide (TPR) repeat protein